MHGDPYRLKSKLYGGIHGKDKAEKEAARLARENERLKERLRQMELVIDAQKKIAEILNDQSKNEEESEEK